MTFWPASLKTSIAMFFRKSLSETSFVRCYGPAWALL
jgi:hypothetical protein